MARCYYYSVTWPLRPPLYLWTALVGGAAAGLPLAFCRHCFRRRALVWPRWACCFSVEYSLLLLTNVAWRAPHWGPPWRPPSPLPPQGVLVWRRPQLSPFCTLECPPSTQQRVSTRIRAAMYTLTANQHCHVAHLLMLLLQPSIQFRLLHSRWRARGCDCLTERA